MALSASPSQIQQNIGQAFNVLNYLRNARLSSSTTTASWQEIQNKTVKKEVHSNAVTQEIINTLLALKGVELDPVTFTPRVKQAQNPWKVSYLSANTFYENRYGLPPPYVFRPTAVLCQSILGSVPSHLHIQNLMFNQTRGFKTKRGNSTGLISGNKAALGKIDVVKVPAHNANIGSDPVLLQRLMETKDVSDRTDLSKDGLNKILSMADLKPEQERRVKIAFAEGYHADWLDVVKHTMKPDHKPDEHLGRLLKMAFAEGYRKSAKLQSNLPAHSFLTGIGRLLSAVASAIFMGLILYIFYTSSKGGNRVELFSADQFEVNPEKVNVTFDDVRGSEEAKKELMSVVDFLKYPAKYTELGAKLPNGCLLVGPPGVGKTLLARAVAGEAGVPFFQASGAEFDEVFVGTGAKKVRQLFAAAKTRAPCVIFIDEIDSVGGKRTTSEMHPYANQTVNQLLTEMDGFQNNEGVVVLGATNKVENLDKALLRPGRFDVQVDIRVPDLRERLSILELYLPKIRCAPDVNVKSIAKSTTGCTGADIENITNHAAMRAAQEGHEAVTMFDIEFAIDKVLMGPQKKRLAEPSVNKCTAWHEAGHALILYYSKIDRAKLHKITILPRGQSLGMTHYLNEERAEYSISKEEILNDMDVAFGGRIAEEIVYGTEGITTGASSDMDKATALATNMVTRFGFSDKLGLRVYPKMQEISPKVQEDIDDEIKRLLTESYARARKVLNGHKKELKYLAEALLEYEELSADDVKIVIEGGKLDKEVKFPMNHAPPTLLAPPKILTS